MAWMCLKVLSGLALLLTHASAVEEASTAAHGLGRRDLLQSVAAVSIVRTAQELDAALQSGAPRIEIQEHLNVVGWSLPQVLPTTASITGRCNTGPPSFESLTIRSYTQGNCVLVSSSTVIRSTASLWVDQLHIVLVDEQPAEGGRLELCNGGFSVCEVQPEGSGDAVLIKVIGEYARLWVTNTVLQGSTSGVEERTGFPNEAYRYLATGIDIMNGAHVFAEGCTITGFLSVRAVAMAGGGSAAFKLCELYNNTIVPSFTGSAVVLTVTVDGQDTGQISFEQTTFRNNTLAEPLVAIKNTTVVYGDDNTPTFCRYKPIVIPADRTLPVPPPECEFFTARSLTLAATEANFLTAQDQWVLAAQQGTPLPSPLGDFPDAQDKRQRWDTNYIIFIAVACFLLLLVGTAAIMCWLWPWWSCVRYPNTPGQTANPSEEAHIVGANFAGLEIGGFFKRKAIKKQKHEKAARELEGQSGAMGNRNNTADNDANNNGAGTSTAPAEDAPGEASSEIKNTTDKNTDSPSTSGNTTSAVATST